MHGIYRGGAAVALVLGMAGAAHAGSFTLKEASASAQGSSFAGATAGGKDISHSFWNPAAMTFAGGTETCFDKGALQDVACGGSGLTVAGALHYIAPNVDGTRADGLSGIDGGLDAVVPAFYIGYRVDDQLVLGLTTGSPFGLATEYEPGEIGANVPNPGVAVNNPRRSDLKLVQIAPIVSYDVNPQLTIAGGPTIAVGKLIFETELLTATGAYAELDVQDVAFGFQIGALFRPSDWATLGVSFHSGYNLSAEGDSEVNDPGGALAGFGFATGVVGDAKVSADLPALFTLGAAIDLTEELTLLGEFQWQNWSALDGLQFSASNIAAGGVQTETFNYDDSIYVAAGLEYDFTEQLTLRTGVGYDQTPTTDADRSARIPDEDRIWLSVGASYQVTQDMKVDLAYSYLTLVDPSIANTNNGGAPTTVEFDGHVHIIGIGGSISY